jgi:hypothetical protein
MFRLFKLSHDSLPRFIGIGFDEKFLKPFVDGKFFAGMFWFLRILTKNQNYFDFGFLFVIHNSTGELYVDANKECYNALQYHRFGYLDLVKLLFSAKWREAIAKVNYFPLSILKIKFEKNFYFFCAFTI